MLAQEKTGKFQKILYLQLVIDTSAFSPQKQQVAKRVFRKSFKMGITWYCFLLPIFLFRSYSYEVSNTFVT